MGAITASMGEIVKIRDNDGALHVFLMREQRPVVHLQSEPIGDVYNGTTYTGRVVYF